MAATSYRTTISGAASILLGLGIGAFGVTYNQATYIPIGLGLVVTGAGLLSARDQAAHVEDAQHVKAEIAEVKQVVKEEVIEEVKDTMVKRS